MVCRRSLLRTGRAFRYSAKLWPGSWCSASQSPGRGAGNFWARGCSLRSRSRKGSAPPIVLPRCSIASHPLPKVEYRKRPLRRFPVVWSLSTPQFRQGRGRGVRPVRSPRFVAPLQHRPLSAGRRGATADAVEHGLKVFLPSSPELREAPPAIVLDQRIVDPAGQPLHAGQGERIAPGRHQQVAHSLVDLHAVVLGAPLLDQTSDVVRRVGLKVRRLVLAADALLLPVELNQQFPRLIPELRQGRRSPVFLVSFQGVEIIEEPAHDALARGFPVPAQVGVEQSAAFLWVLCLVQLLADELVDPPEVIGRLSEKLQRDGLQRLGVIGGEAQARPDKPALTVGLEEIREEGCLG